MNKIKELEILISNYLREYRKEFDKITKKSLESDSIKKEYSEGEKYSDHWGLQSIYSEYSFLSQLDNLERDKLIFTYAIERYISYLKEIEDMNLNKEYLLELVFTIDDDLFTDKIVTLFPDISYFISNKESGKIELKEWHESMEFGRFWDKGRNYLKKIIDELNLSEYFDFNEYYFCDDYHVSIDFNFEISKCKKRQKDYFPS